MVDLMVKDLDLAKAAAEGCGAEVKALMVVLV